MEWGARSIATPTASRPWRSKARTARGASCTRTTPPAARSAACCGGARRRSPASERRSRARGRASSSTPGSGAARAPGSCPTRTVATSACEPRAARDRRRGPGLPRDDEPARRDRRRRGDGLSRRRSGGRSGVRPVSSDRALRIPGQPRFLLSEALRGEGARLAERRRRARSWSATTRRAISRRAIACRGRSSARRDGPARRVPVARAPRSGLRARALSADLRRVPARGARPRPRPGFLSARRPTTSWAACRPISTAARRSPGCLRLGKWPAPACTAPTVWPATRCSRASCLARAPGWRCAPILKHGVPR